MGRLNIPHQPVEFYGALKQETMRIWSILFALCIAAASRAQAVSRTDSLSIISKIGDWNRGWQEKDHALAAKWYSTEAEFTNAFGFSMIGREAIEAYLSEVFAMDHVMAGRSEQTSIRLRSINQDVVLVVSTISRAGQRMADGSLLEDRRTTHHRLFRKEQEWLIVGHLISDARSTERKEH